MYFLSIQQLPIHRPRRRRGGRPDVAALGIVAGTVITRLLWRAARRAVDAAAVR